MKKELQEEWKPIKGYNGLYEVSNQGKVRRCRETNIRQKNSLLCEKSDRNGYKRVRLCKDGKVKAYYVHRIVAEHFIDGFGKEVNHINGNKSDNSIFNLEWCDHKENMIKASQTGLIKSCRKIRQTMNGRIINIFPSLSEAGRNIGGNKGNISKCCQGKRKSAYGYEWSWCD